MSRHRTTVELSLGETGEAVAELAEAWDGEWQAAIDGGTLTLPVIYGLRRGQERGQLRFVREGERRTRVEWRLERSELAVQRPAVAILVVAAVPLLGTTVWPFWPALLPLVPFSAIVGLLAWWLVISRLRTRSPDEFLVELAAAGESSDDVVR